MKIDAAVLHEKDTPFKIEKLDLEPPRSGEVLVEIAAAGVCHSDWHLRAGTTAHPLPVVAGHEGSGVVKAVGEGVARVKEGDHVVLNWSPSCGACFYCRDGRPGLCSTYVEPIWAGTMMDGTPRLSIKGSPVYHYCALACFADHAVVPQESCVVLRKEIPLNVGSLIGCAVTTGVGAVLNTARVRAGSSAAVFGAGGVGLCIVMGARLAGASVIVAVDRLEAKGETALQIGATDALVNGPDTIDAIRSLTEGRGANYVFDATGIPEVQTQCLDAARPGGTVVLAGLAPMESTTRLPGAIITRREKTVTGTYYGTSQPERDFPHYADLYLEGKLPLDRLISKTYSLEEINDAFDDMLNGALARGVIVF